MTTTPWHPLLRIAAVFGAAMVVWVIAVAPDTALASTGCDAFSVPVYASYAMVVEPDGADGEVEVAWFGMSCDGPASCSPQLIYGEKRTRPARSGPVCAPGDPDCALSEGAPASPGSLFLGLTLVPFLADVAFDLPRGPGARQTRRHANRNTLHPRTSVTRLFRPPRAGFEQMR